MNMVILCIGKKHDVLLKDAIASYCKRLDRFVDIKWEIISPSGLSESSASKIESEALVNRLKDNDVIILLDEKGKLLNSEQLAQKIDNLQNNSTKRLVLIIGGAYGVDNTVIKRSTFIWSLSKLVFPHQIVRLLAVEQIYRAYSILNGSKYHHQ